MRRKDHTHPGIYALAIGAFAIGVAEFIVVGVLPAIAAEFSVPLASAGGLVGLYAFALAIGTPLVVLALARLPRKTVLLGLVALFLAGNLLSALSASYPLLLAGRSITAVAHGSFFAIGATIAARLAPEGQASRAIAVMFAGLNLAMVVGVPLGSFIGNSFGWRLPFFAVALLAGLLVVFAALALLMTSKTAMVPLLFIWGVFAFGMSPGFQTGMLDTAERWAPRAVDFASALNISAFNLGITLGQACGSTLVAQGQLAHTPWAGFVLALLAQLSLLWLARRHRCHAGRAGCR
ncbi:hypothetical protein GCM10023078_37560 [Gibbsiella greigii]